MKSCAARPERAPTQRDTGAGGVRHAPRRGLFIPGEITAEGRSSRHPNRYRRPPRSAPNLASRNAVARRASCPPAACRSRAAVHRVCIQRTQGRRRSDRRHARTAASPPCPPCRAPVSTPSCGGEACRCCRGNAAFRQSCEHPAPAFARPPGSPLARLGPASRHAGVPSYRRRNHEPWRQAVLRPQRPERSCQRQAAGERQAPRLAALQACERSATCRQGRRARPAMGGARVATSPTTATDARARQPGRWHRVTVEMGAPAPRVASVGTAARDPPARTGFRTPLFPLNRRARVAVEAMRRARPPSAAPARRERRGGG